MNDDPEPNSHPVRMMEIRNRAKRLGITIALTMSRKELIHQIQTSEGNRPCFKSGISDCRQYDCCWLNECQGC